LISYASSDTRISLIHYNQDVDYTVSGYTQPKPLIHIFSLNKYVAKKYWQNGTFYSALLGRDLTRTDPLTSFAGSAFGGTSFWGYFDGDLAEIIIFSRALTDEERKAIEQYLSKK